MDFTASMDVKNTRIIQEQSAYIAELESENQFLKEEVSKGSRNYTSIAADLNVANSKLAQIGQIAR